MKTFLSILVLLLLPGLVSAMDREIVVASGEWPPWTGKALPHYGFINHVVEEAFAREGYTVTFEFYPWTRNIHLLEHGEIDAASYWYMNKRRQEFALYSAPLSEEEVVFFHLKGKKLPDWQDLSELMGYRIGMVHGIPYLDQLWELKSAGVLHLFFSNTEKENFQKLLRRRIDIFPSARRMGEEVLKNEFPPKERDVITYTPKALITHKGYILFPKNRPESEQLRKAFNTGLKKLRADGTYHRLFKAMDRGAYALPPEQ
ncbi:transporter substrate-binding domain-containing protein [Pseudodesulfovibrio sp. zrk46]|uniref:substrate-binding periplasmic protein n=1 Tax=Pseudodesulfovibrio sp. zrk46 TaxID=2725288 RepID=UPI0014494A03|nr:transporter substrate-binding domain-containing protein [Pseudodesulfovibrio sp. zrk46]QJB55478.1 transporter substrate-binding domain-containing protein [Pseudodesulfovibrio sp. zrk46]